MKQAPTSHFIPCPAYDSEALQGSEPHQLHYLEWGTKASNNTVICVHGLTRNAHDFDFLAGELAAQNYHVIAVDMAGRGQSDWLKNPYHYGYPLYVADILHLIATLQLNHITWVGTSMGGLIGMLINRINPALFSRLILNDIGRFLPGASLMRIGAKVGKDMKHATKEAAMHNMKGRMTTFGIHTNEHWNHVFEHNFFQTDDGHYHYAYDPHIGDAFWNKRGKQRRMENMDFSDLWQAITCPTLVLRGEESDLLLKETFEAMRQGTHVTGVEFSHCGHAPMLMETEQTNVIVRWLK